MLNNLKESDKPYVMAVRSFLEDTCGFTLQDTIYNGKGIEMEGFGSNVPYALIDRRNFIDNFNGYPIKVNYFKEIKTEEDGSKYISGKILNVSAGLDGQVKMKIRLHKIF